MEVLPNAVDYGDAPSFHATGPCRIYFTTPNMLRVVFYRRHMRDDGRMELRVSGSIDWDVAEYQAANAIFSKLMPEVLAEGFMEARAAPCSGVSVPKH